MVAFKALSTFFLVLCGMLYASAFPVVTRERNDLVTRQPSADSELGDPPQPLLGDAASHLHTRRRRSTVISSLKEWVGNRPKLYSTNDLKQISLSDLRGMYIGELGKYNGASAIGKNPSLAPGKAARYKADAERYKANFEAIMKMMLAKGVSSDVLGKLRPFTPNP